MKANDGENYKRFINNEINIMDIAEEVGASSQFISLELRNLDSHIFDKRRENLDKQLRQVYRLLLEGIPLDDVLKLDSVNILRTSREDRSIHRAKDALIALLKRHRINHVEKFSRYIFVRSKLKHYVNTILLEDAFEMDIYKDEDGFCNKALISREYGSSYTKVLRLFKEYENQGRVLTKLSDDIYKVIRRNVNIVKAYQSGTSLETLDKQYGDKIDISLVIQSYTPFIEGNDA